MSADVAVVVGNPKPASRTLAAAVHVATELVGQPDLVVDLAEWGPRLLDHADAQVASLVEQVTSARLVVVASPTYKASFTGLLKLFLDRVPADGLAGTVTVPLMLSASPAHALAAEAFLRPVLTEVGGIVPTVGLWVPDGAHDDPAAYEPWVASARPVVAALLAT